MKAPTNPMKKLYGRLNSLGITKPYVRRHLLPEWWDDEVAAAPGGIEEAIVILARHLGLEPEQLRRPDAELALRQPLSVKFKKGKHVPSSQLALAQSLALQVLRHVQLGVRKQPSLPGSAAEIREEVLDSGARWVDLPALLSLCWNSGVPVVYVSEYPRGAKKMHGMSAMMGDKPGIVISDGRTHSAFLLFVLAHELGHIVLGHVGRDCVLTDQEVDSDSCDEEEKEANAFAVEVLTGSSRTTWIPSGRWPSAKRLASEAARIGAERQVDPGHVVLNYANEQSFFPVAVAALNHLEPTPRAIQGIRDQMVERVDWSALPAAGSEFVMRLTGTRQRESSLR